MLNGVGDILKLGSSEVSKISWTQFPWQQIGWHTRLAGLVAAPLPLCIAVCAGGNIGAGDIKLLAASGLVLGLFYGLLALCIGLICAAIWAAGMLLRGAQKSDTFALGPCLSIGCAVACLAGASLLQMLAP